MLNAALVGCGWVSDWHVADGLAHLPDRFRLVACCDTNPERLNAFALRYGTPRKVTDYDAVLAMSDVDVVIVCTPPALHYPMVRAALRAGKHVVCEKPFAASLAEVDSIIAEEARSRGRCMPIFNYRFGDGIARVRHVITSGLAGRHFVSSAETAKRRGPDYYAVAWRGKFATELGGVLLTQAIHTHDLLLWLIGKPAEVACFKTTRVNPIEVEDCAVGTLRMADGSLASITATLGSARQVTRLRLCFENVTFERVGYDEDSARPGNEPWTIVPKDAGHRSRHRSKDAGSRASARMVRAAVRAVRRCDCRGNATARDPRRRSRLDRAHHGHVRVGRDSLRRPAAHQRRPSQIRRMDSSECAYAAAWWRPRRCP